MSTILCDHFSTRINNPHRQYHPDINSNNRTALFLTLSFPLIKIAGWVYTNNLAFLFKALNERGFRGSFLQLRRLRADRIELI
jgi:hypothetical protein